jgi:iron complex transport system substrate-binding protein
MKYYRAKSPLILVALLLLLAAWSAGTPMATATAAPDSFPVTIEHKYGSTTVPEEPRRVLIVGYSEQDPVLALGVKPIAVRYWFGDEPHAVFPWAQDELGDAQPVVLNMPSELDFERIAALQPDLIIGTYSGITQEEYNTLSKIAPTVPQSGDYIDYGMPWQEQTRMIGRALGRAEQAEQLVAEVEARFEAAGEAHPEWQGKKIIVGLPWDDGTFAFMASQDPRSRDFTSLGFQVPAELDQIAGDQFWGTFSMERSDLLDQDLIVFHQMQWVEGGREAIESDPLFSQLQAMKEGRVLFTEGELDDALQFSSVLSLPFVLDQLVPRMELAMDGDPNTDANP